jgi:predicted NUDIX family NTP pyrophosphohydrolase
VILRRAASRSLRLGDLLRAYETKYSNNQVVASRIYKKYASEENQALARKKTAGVLLYRLRNSAPEVFLVHPGGPFWVKKDLGAWSIPKGEFDEDEEPLNAAKREFQEETGFSMEGNFIGLAPRKQRSGKVIYAWALEGDCDAEAIKSNLFSIEWPPRSGNRREYPEVDRAGWFALELAKQKIVPGQIGFLEELHQIINK